MKGTKGGGTHGSKEKESSPKEEGRQKEEVILLGQKNK